MKALITGATGFIGRRLASRLLREGWEVTALVRRDDPDLPAGVRIVRGDILTPTSLTGAGAGCDRLFHLAALITFDPGRREELFRVNVTGTANILNAAAEWGVSRTVAVSSACTLGSSHDSDRIRTEDDVADAGAISSNPYLASKLEAERVIASVSGRQWIVVVNPTTVYGPGDYSLNSGSLINTVARARWLLPAPAGGSNCVDVDDVVEGILLAADKGRSGRRYVLGAANLSYTQIFKTIASALGRRVRMAPIPGVLSTPLALAGAWAGRLTGNRFLSYAIIADLFRFKYYSDERARAELGWSPHYTFTQSVSRAWSFYQSLEKPPSP